MKNWIIAEGSIINEPYTMGNRVEIMEGVILGTQPVTYEVISHIPLRRRRIQAKYGFKFGNDVTIHAGSIIMAGLERPTTLEDRVIVGQKVNVGHDAEIGRGARIMIGVEILGFASIGAGSYIGSGAVIKQGISVGNHSVVGMGATVTKDIPDNCKAYNATKSGEPVYCRYIQKTRSYMKAFIRELIV